MVKKLRKLQVKAEMQIRRRRQSETPFRVWLNVFCKYFVVVRISASSNSPDCRMNLEHRSIHPIQEPENRKMIVKSSEPT